MTDTGFPLIRYQVGKGPRAWGQSHGESFRAAIGELVAIRTGLLLARNPALKGERLHIEAAKQFEATRNFSPDVFEEMDGIREGAKVSATDIVVLNNYTDFRDVPGSSDEGCSTVYVRREGRNLAGQTWDMHASARNFVCVIHVPKHKADRTKAPETVLFSLVGCVGLMGYNARGAMIGVNNLNGVDARSGIAWPALVRRCLHFDGVDPMRETLKTAAVTSAHNYLIADRGGTAEMWEIFPTLRHLQAEAPLGGDTTLYHTNHCLDDASRKLEAPSAVASTSHDRYEILKRKVGTVKDLPTFHSLLTDHEGYPKSICSHFESGAQDPSTTCGGAVGDLDGGEVRLWRGCPGRDPVNYRELSVRLTMET